MSTTPDLNEITKALRQFVAIGDIGEIRVLGSGAPFGFYFSHDSIDKAAALAATYSKSARGIYIVMNRIGPALSDRPQLVKTYTLTTDEDITRRTELLLDFDPSSPERGADDSATDAEKEAARLKMEEVFEWLRDLGFPEPIVADSGNGWHLLFRIDLPNEAKDDDSHRLIRDFLNALSKRFSDDQVAVDISVHNASRITKLYGTTARKGQDRPDRPHRLSKLLTVPDGGAGVVSAERIVTATKLALAEAGEVVEDGSLFDQTSTTVPRINGDAHTSTTPKLILPETFPVGGRHEMMTRLAGATRSFGANETEILAILRTFNLTRCSNGKPDDELAKIARDFSTKDVNLPMRALIECATEDQVENAERQQKLRHALQHALKRLGEGRDVTEVADTISTVLGTIGATAKPQTFETLTSRELDDGAFALDYFVAEMLVKSQPCVLAGPKKCLKTNILIDLTLSLASQAKFLNEFYIAKPVRAALVSGESGQATIQETARRETRSKPWKNLADYENAFWCFDLPKLGQPDTAKTIIAYIQKHALDVLVLDPAYLCMPLGESASNLFLVGAMLADLTKVMAETGCTIILCHHTKKSVTDTFAAPELENISWSGFQEWARQWILLGRREAYDPEQAGSHKLWLSAGGSAGHSGLWALDIEEGSRKDQGGRRWDVQVQNASTAIAATIEQREEAKVSRAEEKSAARIESDAAKLLKVYQRFPQGDTAKFIRETAGLNPPRFAQANLKLVDDKLIEACRIKKHNREEDAFRLRSHGGTGGTTAEQSPPVPPSCAVVELPPFRGSSTHHRAHTSTTTAATDSDSVPAEPRDEFDLMLTEAVA